MSLFFQTKQNIYLECVWLLCSTPRCFWKCCVGITRRFCTVPFLVQPVSHWIWTLIRGWWCSLSSSAHYCFIPRAAWLTDVLTPNQLLLASVCQRRLEALIRRTAEPVGLNSRTTLAGAFSTHLRRKEASPADLVPLMRDREPGKAIQIQPSP